jgi:hypothetical protein
MLSVGLRVLIAELFVVDPKIGQQFPKPIH